jgi:hypothetical protein
VEYYCIGVGTSHPFVLCHDVCVETSKCDERTAPEGFFVVAVIVVVILCFDLHDVPDLGSLWNKVIRRACSLMLTDCLVVARIGHVILSSVSLFLSWSLL